MSCAITNVGSSNKVGEYTDISVSFIVTNEVPQDGYFELGMPKWNAGTQVRSLAQPMIYDYSSFNYDVMLGGYLVPCSSVNHGGLTCII